MKVLMLGWEYPPKISGGLGIASQGVAEALAKSGHDITFLMPKFQAPPRPGSVDLREANAIEPDYTLWNQTKSVEKKIKRFSIGVSLLPYLPADYFTKVNEEKKIVKELAKPDAKNLLKEVKLSGSYSGEIKREMVKYALLASQCTIRESFDVIHCHDWMTFSAGIMAQSFTDIPLVLHVHSTEMDRNGVHAQKWILEEEKKGFKKADKIITVSSSVRNLLVQQYGVEAQKIIVVPNGISTQETKVSQHQDGKKRIGFVGRLVNQKGPSFFLDMARELLNRQDNIEFVMAGDGHLLSSLKERAKGINLYDKINFAGFLDHQKTVDLIASLDLLVVPSISEPFGLVVLEAISNNTLAVVSKGAGIAEYVPSLPQCDYWDTFNYSRLIESLLFDNETREKILKTSQEQASKLTWESAARVVEKVYKSIKSSQAA
ncbi:MAG: glycosyltransferase family 4 protein [Cyclobacteriaceae bacterium]|nr:glycosyltransferase family 4 protein [Cyclobacteriaceae bacterium HetDA_MAG_MS6]